MPGTEKNAFRRTNSVPIHTERDQQRQAPQNTGLQTQPLSNQAGGRTLQNPLRIHAVNDTFTQVQLIQPDETEIRRAFKKAGLEWADTAKKKHEHITNSVQRYQLQVRLNDKIRSNTHPSQARQVELKKAVEISDEDLVRHYGEYGGESAQYMNVRYNLMKNRYYNLLPVKEMRKLTREELFSKLRKEYEKEPARRKTGLIAFYQDLIRMKQFEDSLDKKELRRNPEHPPLNITEAEERYNREAYDSNIRKLDSLHISQPERRKRKEAMQRVMLRPAAPELGFLQDKDAKDVKKIKPEQKEGIRQVLAWMYRNCNKSSQSKEPFVYKLTTARPDQLLLMFYLIENNMQESPNAECFYTAITDYIPDLNTFKERVVASKLRFWKRTGSDASDSVIDWSKLGQAARFALNCDVLNDYHKYSSEVHELTEKLKDPAKRGSKTKEELLYDILVQEGKQLLTMYRAAGLSPDMPADLIEDSRLKDKIGKTVSEFSTVLDALRAERRINPRNSRQAGNVPGRTGSQGPSDKAPVTRGLAHKNEDPSAMDIVGDATAVVDAFMDIDKALELFKDAPELSFRHGRAFSVSTSGVGALVAFIDLINTFIDAHNLRLAAPALTTADHTAKALSVTGSAMGGVGTVSNEVTGIVGSFVDIGSNASDASWYGSTTVMTTTESFSTVSGGVQFCAGAVALAAGSLQTTSAGIELGRAMSSRRDVKRARTTLTREITKDPLQNKPEKNLTEEQKKQRKEREALRNLLKHQDRSISNQRDSGIVKTVGGVISMVGGASMLTGYLAPIGGILSLAGSMLSIGYGLLYARHRRNLTRKQAVDDSLKLDAAVQLVIANNPELTGIKGKRLDALKDQIRQEALAELGYATYKECFSDLSKKNALMLYRHVFEMPENTEDHKMFEDTLKSLGLKIRKSDRQGRPNMPTVQMIYAKLMG